MKRKNYKNITVEIPAEIISTITVLISRLSKSSTCKNLSKRDKVLPFLSEITVIQ